MSTSVRATTVGETYAQVAELPLRVQSYSLEAMSAPMGPDRVRHSTIVRLSGGGQEGVGEDATPTEDEQLAFQRAAPSLPLAGDWTVASFSSHLGSLDLFPTPPVNDWLRSFRRWGFESASLDLALRQAGVSLAAALGRSTRPLTFVNSMRLADPPTVEPIRERLELFPGLRFKLDPTAEWDARLIGHIAATGAVDTLDLKSQYPPPFGQPANPELYELIANAFPDAWLEDPALTEETLEVLTPHQRRITWDAPLHSIADIEALTTRPRAINIKPVRFGTLQTLFDVYDYCAAHDIAMYGGGFGELGPGRHHIQYLASLFHPDTPNDVAPSGYNLAAPDPALPTSPLTRAAAATGFRWA